MLAILFLFLALTATKVGLWQMGLFSSFVNSPQTADFTLGSLSLIAAIIFFRLSMVGLVHRKKAKANILFE
jgi:hypothetical protein